MKTPRLLAFVGFVAALIVALGWQSQAQSEWKVFYDPDLPSPLPKLGYEESTLVYSDADRLYTKVRGLCGEARNLQIYAAAKGSFTRANATQTAYLVRLCFKRDDLLDAGINGRYVSSGDYIYGLIVHERGRLVDAFTTRGADQLYSTKDINQNGRSELVYIEQHSGNEYRADDLRVAEFNTKGNLVRIGAFDNVSATDFDKRNEGVWREHHIYVQKGKRPRFFADITTKDIDKTTLLGVQRSVPIKILY